MTTSIQVFPAGHAVEVVIAEPNVETPLSQTSMPAGAEARIFSIHGTQILSVREKPDDAAE